MLMRVGRMQPEFRVPFRAAVIFAVAMILYMLMNLVGSDTYYSDYAVNVISTIPIMLFLVASVGLSVSMSSLGNKSARVNSIMIPATRGEKFVARVIMALVVSIVTLLLLLLVLAGVLSVLSIAFDPPGQLAATFSNMGIGNIEVVNGSTGMVHNYDVRFLSFSMSLCVLAAYLFGGVLWKGSSWPITTALLIVILLLACFGIDSVSSTMTNDECMMCLSSRSAYVVLLLVTYMVTVLLVWLSYRSFARMQAVKPKWSKFFTAHGKH